MKQSILMFLYGVIFTLGLIGIIRGVTYEMETSYGLKRGLETTHFFLPTGPKFPCNEIKEVEIDGQWMKRTMLLIKSKANGLNVAREMDAIEAIDSLVGCNHYTKPEGERLKQRFLAMEIEAGRGIDWYTSSVIAPSYKGDS